MKKQTLTSLNKLVAEGGKFTCLTSYDATMASLINAAGVESILVGDSLGMVIQGHQSTLPVTVDDIIYHTQAVARANSTAFILSDLPFMSYQNTETALINSGKVMQAGAEMIKLEGGEWLTETVFRLAQNGVPTCIHMGLTPQSVNKFGGYRVQGRGEDASTRMLNDAKAIEEAGADFLLLECVPRPLAQAITAQAGIPVIGIGAGPDTDAQVLVSADMLGMNLGHKARFVKDYVALTGHFVPAIELFVKEVKEGLYPAPEHWFES
ncbi:3-methyl-2-oxobutanoate hydroxymethyltransferase [Gynuella sunshinyii]|uniref:3-methyl-2-oxobutanoate hydroxymethyltransferase n=1 Tax=Gynuella sunshinyii YC6258 TaxID=1445510 RepID=A0A0C5VSU4_9GAMM|nr:3-methyl-2-oxobutanoate hydroxymethyltransferase [Gynuella sunshinyii]AJQ97246.1 ketopantoate hydroxymethyltransferase [Gynuella sunshinyii YC6258]